MKTRTKITLFVGTAVFLAIIVAAVCVVTKARYNAAPCVTVNGTVVTNEEIDIAYNQQKDGVTPVTRAQVIDATVRNTVVRDYGRQLGIAVTDAEVDDIIEGYHHTGYYDAAAETYGEDGLRQGLYNHALFTRTKEHILAHEVGEQAVTDADIAAFLAENGLAGMTLTDKHRADITAALTDSKREQAYNAFVDELVTTATIVYGE